MDIQRIRLLFEKHIQAELTTAEKEELDLGLKSIDEATFSSWIDQVVRPDEKALFPKEDVFTKIEERLQLQEEQITQGRRWHQQPLLRIAAMLVLLLGSLLLYINYNQHKLSQFGSQQAAVAPQELTLPDEEALITLADGTQLHFDAHSQDSLEHKGLAIYRLADGSLQLSQEAGIKEGFAAQQSHRLAAPKGVSLRVILADKSVVWLNAGSAIRVSASYGAKDRSLELDGEAYFDVSHNPKKPFLVKAKNTSIKVLGTQFNMAAYSSSNQVQTTLVEGSVTVSALQQTLVLKPGQQAVVSPDASIQLHTQVNLHQVLGWKEGYFRFKDESIEAIMEELARWYPIAGVDIRAGKGDRFTGSIQRSKKLTALLASLEKVSDLKFVIEEGRVVVMK